MPLNLFIGCRKEFATGNNGRNGVPHAFKTAGINHLGSFCARLAIGVPSTSAPSN
jgi:hypothetical protein